GRLRDQRRGIALELARALGEQLADLRLGIAGDNVAMALLDELHPPLEILRSRRSAHRHEGKAEGADAADDEKPQEHTCLRLSLLMPGAVAAPEQLTLPRAFLSSRASTLDCRPATLWPRLQSPEPILPRWRGSGPCRRAY